MRTFDLLEFQREARDSCSQQFLYELFEDCSKRYDKQEITQYQYVEMKDVILSRMEVLGALKRGMES